MWNKKTISKDPKTNLERKWNAYGKYDINIKMSYKVQPRVTVLRATIIPFSNKMFFLPSSSEVSEKLALSC
jgi:hypothetical protein